MSTQTEPAPTSPSPAAGPERNDRIRLVAVLVAIGGVVLLAITAIALLSGDDAVTGDDGASAAGDWGGTLIEPAPDRPDFTLTDTDGRPYAFGTETAGQLTLLFFGYTHCPDVCPVQMSVVGAALEKPGVPQPKVVFVTTDPERDTPERLRHWLDQMPGGERFVGLRGTPEDVAAAEAAAEVPGSVRLPADDGDAPDDYQVGHAAQIMAYTPDDKAHLAYPFGVRTEDWIADLPRMMSEWGDSAAGGASAARSDGADAASAGGSRTAGGTEGLSAGDAFASASEDLTAVYVTIENPGDDDTLVGARSSAAGRVTLMSGESGGAMEDTDRVAVPTGTTRFAAGGAHIMLDELDGALKPGDAVPLELEFEKAGTVTVDVDVLDWDAMVERIERTDGAGSAAAEGAAS